MVLCWVCTFRRKRRGLSFAAVQGCGCYGRMRTRWSDTAFVASPGLSPLLAIPPSSTAWYTLMP